MLHECSPGYSNTKLSRFRRPAPTETLDYVAQLIGNTLFKECEIWSVGEYKILFIDQNYFVGAVSVPILIVINVPMSSSHIFFKWKHAPFTIGIEDIFMTRGFPFTGEKFGESFGICII